jgi:hypothetical protein
MEFNFTIPYWNHKDFHFYCGADGSDFAINLFQVTADLPEAK